MTPGSSSIPLTVIPHGDMAMKRLRSEMGELKSLPTRAGRAIGQGRRRRRRRRQTWFQARHGATTITATHLGHSPTVASTLLFAGSEVEDSQPALRGSSEGARDGEAPTDRHARAQASSSSLGGSVQSTDSHSHMRARGWTPIAGTEQGRHFGRPRPCRPEPIVRCFRHSGASPRRTHGQRVVCLCQRPLVVFGNAMASSMNRGVRLMNVDTSCAAWATLQLGGMAHSLILSFSASRVSSLLRSGVLCQAAAAHFEGAFSQLKTLAAKTRAQAPKNMRARHARDGKMVKY